LAFLQIGGLPGDVPEVGNLFSKLRSLVASLSDEVSLSSDIRRLFSGRVSLSSASMEWLCRIIGKLSDAGSWLSGLKEWSLGIMGKQSDEGESWSD